MKYIDVQWLHENSEDPVRLLSELDQDGYETRKLEFFSDGCIGFACASAASLGVELGSAPVPPLGVINASEEFNGVEIAPADFEVIWSRVAPRSPSDPE